MHGRKGDEKQMATKTNAKRKTKSPSGFARRAAIVARRDRSIQRRIDRKRKPKSKRKSAMQAGARRYPALPLPTEHLAKPGREAALKLAPMCDAQHYLGSRKLEGMAALITAADSSIDRAVADFRRFGRSMHSISSGF